MAVRMLSRPMNTAGHSGSSAAVRDAVRTKYSEYSAPTQHGQKASELAKEIREFETKVEANPRSAVRGRDAKSGLFK
ncbi:hypothetical protein DSM25558_4845 [Agrobacterium sp. DSM 25558]|nr:hypothetical protein DSM25558_4845 [Agrobacterium sp. DSM 25558]